MKINYLLILLFSSNALAYDDKLQNCTKVLGAGIYNSYLENECKFKGSVSQKLKNLYTSAKCREIVPQSQVDQVIKAVGDDVNSLISTHGKEKFCRENKKAYFELK